MTPELLQQPFKTAAPAPYGYTFEGVVVELARGRLIVDGRDAKAGSLRLKLLRLLCESPKLLVSREQLFDAVWPRQVVSDEALTKLIGRLREALGPYGDLLVTVRGLGLRLDASVQTLMSPPPLDDTDSAPLHSGDEGEAKPANGVANLRSVSSLRVGWETARASSAAASEPPVKRWFASKRNAVLATLIAVLGLVAVGTTTWLATRGPSGSGNIVVAGFGIAEADVGTNRAETLALLRQIELAWNGGDLERARAMLLALHQSDTQTAIPGALFAYANAASDVVKARSIVAEAKQRLREDSTPYARLLVSYVVDSSNDPVDNGGAPTLRALTEMRPSAWQLQLGLAHKELIDRRYNSALAALRRVPMEGVSGSVLGLVLADRVSLGDTEAVARLLAEGVLAKVPIDEAIAWGRVEWSRGNIAAAVAHMDNAVELAQDSNAYISLVRAREYGALFSYAMDGSDVDVRILSTIETQMANSMRVLTTHEFKALLAERLLEQGDRPGAVGLLEEVADMPIDYMDRIILEIFNARLGNVLPAGSFFSGEQRQSLERTIPNALPLLVDAWTAYAAGDADAAGQLLAQSRARGIDRTYLQEDAALLDAVLSKRAQPRCRPDPPYPNRLRFSTCRALARVGSAG